VVCEQVRFVALGGFTDMDQNALNRVRLGEERNDLLFAIALGINQRKDFIDPCNQHRPVNANPVLHSYLQHTLLFHPNAQER
jgi:hypothetical protein